MLFNCLAGHFITKLEKISSWDECFKSLWPRCFPFPFELYMIKKLVIEISPYIHQTIISWESECEEVCKSYFDTHCDCNVTSHKLIYDLLSLYVSRRICDSNMHYISKWMIYIIISNYLEEKMRYFINILHDIHIFLSYYKISIYVV